MHGERNGVRIGWSDLPAPVRKAVEQILGGPVVEARSQPGGFSPGTADRVVTALGARTFVKAVSPDQNAETPALHRREAVVTAALPAGAPLPRLLGTFDDGHWVVLVLSDVEGRHPVTPWSPVELQQVMAALGRLAVATTPAPLADLAPAEVAAHGSHPSLGLIFRLTRGQPSSASVVRVISGAYRPITASARS